MGLFDNRLNSKDGAYQYVPVWFMRQAGRYHNHYQNIKKDSDFMTMCKNPQLAADVTMGPIEEFKFDAAILFSDLLFPLEQVGMGLSYHSGPPTLEFRIEKTEDIKKLKIIKEAESFYQFQKSACEILKTRLPKDCSLLGFVGGPFTLYTYAVEGAHSGNLISSKLGFHDGRYQAFFEMLFPQILKEMSLQAEGGAEAVALFDTAAGECDFFDFKEFIIPSTLKLIAEFKKLHPKTRVIYYSKLTHMHYLNELSRQDKDQLISVLGVDWRMDIVEALKTLGDKYYIQGNLDPVHLHLPWNLLEKKLENYFSYIKNSKVDMSRWIMGLGHGVLQKTPEENVFKAVQYIHENFKYQR